MNTEASGGRRKKVTPGVGDYHIQRSETQTTFFKSAPKFSIGSARRDTFPDKDGPAPNQYMVEYKQLHTQAPRPALAQSKRLTPRVLKKGNMNYSSQLRLQSAKVRHASPGPGDYFLPVTFANAPTYNTKASTEF